MYREKYIAAKERWTRTASAGCARALGALSCGRLPPEQRRVKELLILDLGVHPEVPLAGWRVDLGGLVERPTNLTWEDWRALPRVALTAEFHCVTGWRAFDIAREGVPFTALYELVRPQPVAHGGPARTVIPRLYAWKSAKWLRGPTFLAQDQLGFWKLRGYSYTADPFTNDRFA